MVNFVLRQLAQILDNEGVKYSDNQVPEFQFSRVSVSEKKLLQDVYGKLGGLKPELVKEIPPSFSSLLVENRILTAHGELSFNRYKATVLRSPFYDNYAGFKVESYLRYCRQFEHNCLKAGLRAGVWTSALAELHFGRPAEAGDFFGNGSPGWKLIAYQDFLRDFSVPKAGLLQVHFAVYDQLMLNGKLAVLGDLLRSPGSDQYKAVVKYLRRRLDLPALPAE